MIRRIKVQEAQIDWMGNYIRMTTGSGVFYARGKRGNRVEITIWRAYVRASRALAVMEVQA